MVKRVYYSHEMIKAFVLDIARQMYINDWQPEYIVGINRGGLTPALMLSHFMKLPMYTLDVRLRDGDGPESNTWMAEDAYGLGYKNILIVDDINDTGDTFNYIIKNFGKEDGRVKFAALIHNTPSKAEVDYHGYIIDKSKNPAWIVFPWEEWDK